MQKNSQKYIGKNVLRFEDERLLSGNGVYTSDIMFSETLHLSFLRSNTAHGKIISINKLKALEIKGVHGIFTYEDFKEVPPIKSTSRMKNYFATNQNILCSDKIRYVGEPIAVIVAENRYIAEDAAELIEIEIKNLDPVIDTLEAMKSRSTILHDEIKSNVILERNFNSGDKSFLDDKNLLSVKNVFKMTRKSPVSMETRSYICNIDKITKVLTLYSSTQVPGVIKDALNLFLKIPGNKLNVIAPDVGGGFGGKASLYPEEIITVLLCQKFKRPIKWVSDRFEDFMSTSQGFEEVMEVELFFKPTGQFIGLDGKIIGDVGSYSIYPWTAALEPMQVAGFLQGPYKIDNFKANVKCVVTNKPPTGPYRGVGRPAAVFAIERLVDMASKKLKVDPAKLRLQNMIDKKDLPYRIGSGIVWNKAGFKECLKSALKTSKYEKIKKTKSNENLNWIGIGIASYGELTGIGSKISVAPGMPLNTGTETGTIEIDSTGSISGTFAIASHGQGLETTLAQIIAETLGTKPEDIKINQGNTSLIKHGTGTYASRSAAIAGSVAIKSTKKLKRQIIKIASYIFETSTKNIHINDGFIFQKDTNKKISFYDLAKAVYSDMETLPIKLRKPLVVSETYDPIFGATTTATHIAFVEINAETYKVKIKDYVVSEDCGKIINPMIVDGQVQGGVAQGIGAALYEELKYDETGQLQTASLADYQIPTSSETINMKIEHIENFLPDNLGKFKGMGEGGTIGATAAIANAVSDAISHLNIEITELPISQDKLYNLINMKEKQNELKFRK